MNEHQHDNLHMQQPQMSIEGFVEGVKIGIIWFNLPIDENSIHKTVGKLSLFYRKKLCSAKNPLKIVIYLHGCALKGIGNMASIWLAEVFRNDLSVEMCQAEPPIHLHLDKLAQFMRNCGKYVHIFNEGVDSEIRMKTIEEYKHGWFFEYLIPDDQRASGVPVEKQPNVEVESYEQQMGPAIVLLIYYKEALVGLEVMNLAKYARDLNSSVGLIESHYWGLYSRNNTLLVSVKIIDGVVKGIGNTTQLLLFKNDLPSANFEGPVVQLRLQHLSGFLKNCGKAVDLFDTCISADRRLEIAKHYENAWDCNYLIPNQQRGCGQPNKATQIFDAKLLTLIEESKVSELKNTIAVNHAMDNENEDNLSNSVGNTVGSGNSVGFDNSVGSGDSRYDRSNCEVLFLSFLVEINVDLDKFNEWKNERDLPLLIVKMSKNPQLPPEILVWLSKQDQLNLVIVITKWLKFTSEPRWTISKIRLMTLQTIDIRREIYDRIHSKLFPSSNSLIACVYCKRIHMHTASLCPFYVTIEDRKANLLRSKRCVGCTQIWCHGYCRTKQEKPVRCELCLSEGHIESVCGDPNVWKHLINPQIEEAWKLFGVLDTWSMDQLKTFYVELC